MSSHVLIWKDGRDGAPNSLLDWSEFSLTANPNFFRKVGGGQVGVLAANAAFLAIERGVDLTIAWTSDDLWNTPAAELELTVRKLQPATIICPERPGKIDRWTVSSCGATGSLPLAAVQGALSDIIARAYPSWRHGEAWNASALLLRHKLSAEELGIVEPRKLGPDDIVNLVSTDPEVLKANRECDPSLPATMRDLIRARLEAQTRLGIAPSDRVPVYSGEVETVLTPIVMRMVRGGGPAALASLRQSLQRRYLDQGEIVLQFMLRTYAPDGPGIKQLRDAAAELPAASTAA